MTGRRGSNSIGFPTNKESLIEILLQDVLKCFFPHKTDIDFHSESEYIAFTLMVNQIMKYIMARGSWT
jgi:hypothetical protein